MSVSSAVYTALIHMTEGAEINPAGVTTWLKDNIVPLAILVLGLLLFGHARKGDHAKALTSTALILVALMVVAMGVQSGTGVSLGTWLLNLVTGGATATG